MVFRGILWMMILLLLLPGQLLVGEELEDESVEPIPYDPEEFPHGLRTLRRAEIIFFGSIPITFLLSGLGWELGEAAAGDAYAYDDQQHAYNVIITAGALSFGIALLDYLLGL